VKLENLAKISEDKLIQLMEDNENNEELVSIIDRELDNRAAILSTQQEAIKTAKIEKELLRQQLLKEYEHIKQTNGEKVTMKAMVIEFGDIFVDNYHIDNAHNVHSNCSSINNGDSCWSCGDLDEAQKKVNQLIYYRVYDVFFRNGPTNETLDRLTIKLMEILSE